MHRFKLTSDAHPTLANSSAFDLFTPRLASSLTKSILFPRMTRRKLSSDVSFLLKTI